MQESVHPAERAWIEAPLLIALTRGDILGLGLSELEIDLRPAPVGSAAAARPARAEGAAAHG